MTAQLSQTERVNIGFQFYGVIRHIASSLTEKNQERRKCMGGFKMHTSSVELFS